MSTYFSDILKKLRAEKGISQQTLAEKMYVNRSTVTRWESGIRLPDAMMISRLAEILGADVNMLLSAAAESDEYPNVIMVDDRKLILKGGLPILEKVLPDAVVTGFTNTLFRMPPLTLQPIVENAVKHGMSASNDPIHISVTTRKTDTASEIIVEDNGSGYNPVEDNEPHIALNNIRERLKTMCGGSLEITPREGGGTRVTIFIPMKQTKER